MTNTNVTCITREACVTAVRWEDPNGGPRRILKMSDKEIWIGAVGNVLPGAQLKAQGHYEMHPKFGPQFVVEQLLSSTLETANSAETWIAHRLPHIGDIRAARIVQTYGDGVWEVIRDRHMELTSIDGITEAFATEIHAAYCLYEQEQRVVTTLVDVGLRFHLALATYRHFGESVETVLNDDPYRLMDVDGITFDTADATAQRLGVDRTDARRAKAKVRAQMEESLAQGDCYESTMTMVGVVRSVRGKECTIRGALDLLIESEYVVVRSRTCMLRSINYAETIIADNLRRLHVMGPMALSQARYAEGDIVDDSKLLTADALPERLDPSQKAAVLGLVTDAMCVLTGGPGTGKTTTLLTALEIMEDSGEHVVLAAPTGKAAKRMSEVTKREATTIHKLLKWSPHGWQCNSETPVRADVVVIDEASMVDVQLMAALLDAIGDARLILVGDVDQLPPVGAGQPFSDIIESRHVPVYRLTKTHRQAGDSWVIDNAKRIITGAMPTLNKSKDFFFQDCKSVQEIIDIAVDLYKRNPGLQLLTPEHKNGAGTLRMNNAIQAALNPISQKQMAEFVQGDNYRIYPNDKVLCTRNNGDLGLVNGDMGVVVSISSSASQKFAVVDFDGIGKITLEGGQLKHLTLAYAMTIHKSQGSEWPVVAVIVDPEHRSLRRELLYTAITRTSDKLALLGQKKAIEHAVGKQRANNRRTLLVSRLRGEELA